MKKDEQKGYLFERFKGYRPEADAEILWQKVEERLEKDKNRSFPFWWLPIGILVIAGFLLGSGSEKQTGQKVSLRHTDLHNAGHSVPDDVLDAKRDVHAGRMAENQGVKFDPVHHLLEDEPSGISSARPTTLEQFLPESTLENRIIKQKHTYKSQRLAYLPVHRKSDPNPQNRKYSGNNRPDFQCSGINGEQRDLHVSGTNFSTRNSRVDHRENDQTWQPPSADLQNSLVLERTDTTEENFPHGGYAAKTTQSDQENLSTDSSETESSFEADMAARNETILLKIDSAMKPNSASRFYLITGPVALVQNAKLSLSQSESGSQNIPTSLGTSYGWCVLVGWQESVVSWLRVGLQVHLPIINQSVRYTEITLSPDFEIKEDPTTGTVYYSRKVTRNRFVSRWSTAPSFSLVGDFHTKNSGLGARLGCGIQGWYAWSATNSPEVSFRARPSVSGQLYSRFKNWEFNLQVSRFTLQSGSVPAFDDASSINLLLGLGIGKRF